jgi:hypothetical protein
MRFVQKPAACPPHLTTADITQRLNNVFNYPNSPLTNLLDEVDYQDAYRGKTIVDDKIVSLTAQALEVLYHGKCAYCETRGVIEIEHYRPKKGPRQKGHHGYYWLCYEWTNLVPACHDCNRIGTGKGAQFPLAGLAGSRRSRPGESAPGIIDLTMSLASHTYLMSEQPLLLHPELDNPKHHLKFEVDSENSYIEIKGCSARGEKSIKVYNLHRKALTRGRKEVVIQPALELLNGALNTLDDITDPVAKKNCIFRVFQQLDSNAFDELRSHTLLRRYIVETPAQFEALVVNEISNSAARIIITAAFRAYRRLNPLP